MWDGETGQELAAFSGDGKDIYGVALSPNGDLLAMSNQDGDIILWDLNSGGKIAHLIWSFRISSSSGVQPRWDSDSLRQFRPAC